MNEKLGPGDKFLVIIAPSLLTLEAQRSIISALDSKPGFPRPSKICSLQVQIMVTDILGEEDDDPLTLRSYGRDKKKGE